MSASYETYEEVVEQIKSLATRTVEDRFAIGALVDSLLRKGYELDKIADEVGISATTLMDYRETWKFWGDLRIADCTVWWCYKVVKEWPKDFLKELDVIRRATVLGREVIDTAQITFERRKRTMMRIIDEAHHVKTAPERFMMGLWNMTVAYDELDVDRMTEEEVQKIARAFQAVVSCASKFKKQVQKKAG
jgi:hypothetical protein